jgi:hypothetical protein
MEQSLTTDKPRQGRRTNYRLLALVLIVVAVVGYPVYELLQVRIFGAGTTKEGDLTVVDLKALGNFPLDENTSTIQDIPPKWLALDGDKVAIDGYMYAGASASDEVSDFQLVHYVHLDGYPDEYHRPPSVQQRVFVHGRDGKKFEFEPKLVRVVGTLHVRIKRDDAGRIISVFDLDADQVSAVK